MFCLLAIVRYIIVHTPCVTWCVKGTTIRAKFSTNNSNDLHLTRYKWKIKQATNEKHRNWPTQYPIKCKRSRAIRTKNTSSRNIFWYRLILIEKKSVKVVDAAWDAQSREKKNNEKLGRTYISSAHTHKLHQLLIPFQTIIYCPFNRFSLFARPTNAVDQITKWLKTFAWDKKKKKINNDDHDNDVQVTNK